jgi:hypothetical protein
MPTNLATAEPTAEPTPEPTAQATSEPTPPAPAEPIFGTTSVMLGLPEQGGTPGATTPVAALGQYVTWRAVLGVANDGKPIDVEVATRLQGRWTGWSKLTSRVADAEGVVAFSWRQRSPAWISVRFAVPEGQSNALQGRWR